MSDNKWSQPKDVSEAHLVFGGNVTGEFLPERSEIPREFFDSHNKWASFVSNMFFRGWDGADPVLIRKPDVDADVAFRHIRTVVGSWEPKHENKIAGAAYLLSLWFADVVPASEVEVTE